MGERGCERRLDGWVGVGVKPIRACLCLWSQRPSLFFVLLRRGCAVHCMTPLCVGNKREREKRSTRSGCDLPYFFETGALPPASTPLISPRQKSGTQGAGVLLSCCLNSRVHPDRLWKYGRGRARVGSDEGIIDWTRRMGAGGRKS